MTVEEHIAEYFRCRAAVIVERKGADPVLVEVFVERAMEAMHSLAPARGEQMPTHEPKD